METAANFEYLLEQCVPRFYLDEINSRDVSLKKAMSVGYL